ncbi:uncharacterized protein LOC144133183 isoform X2 [Amblyomma americanum]
MYKNYSSGRHCAIVGCKNNQRKRKLVMDENCAEHLCKRRVCMCGVYSLHRFPAAPEKCREWEIALNRKNFKPSKLARVCSVHFIDGKPTALNPCPMLKLGYAKKVTRGRRPILRTLQPKAASVQIMDSQGRPELHVFFPFVGRDGKRMRQNPVAYGEEAKQKIRAKLIAIFSYMETCRQNKALTTNCLLAEHEPANRH